MPDIIIIIIIIIIFTHALTACKEIKVLVMAKVSNTVSARYNI